MTVIVTRKSRRTRWYILLVASNGKIVATTEHYFSKSNAVRAAKNIVDSANTSGVAPWRLQVA